MCFVYFGKLLLIQCLCFACLFYQSVTHPSVFFNILHTYLCLSFCYFIHYLLKSLFKRQHLCFSQLITLRLCTGLVTVNVCQSGNYHGQQAYTFGYFCLAEWEFLIFVTKIWFDFQSKMTFHKKFTLSSKKHPKVHVH